MGDWFYSYDTLNRLGTAQNVLATSIAPQYAGQYGCWGYDSFGNRTAEYYQAAACPTPESSVPVPHVNQITYNGSNQVLTANVAWGQTNLSGTFQYDAAGNVLSDITNNYLYDAEGRLCAVKNSVTSFTQYVYDAEGRRVAKGSLQSWPTGSSCNAPTAANGFTLTSQYLLDLGGNQVTELNSSPNPANNWVHSNLWPGGHLDATYDTRGLHFHFADPLGSRRVQTNAAGLVEENCQSLPFGNSLTCIVPPTAPTSADDATEHHFTGKERDSESGNDYFGARYYGSMMGRFLSPDPLMASAKA